MQSPWESDYRTRQGDFDDLRSERSTSAPPSESALNFGRTDGVVGNAYLGSGMIHGDPGTKDLPFNALFDDRNRGSGVEVGSLFLDSEYSNRERDGAASSYNHRSQSGFSSDFLASERALSSSLPRSSDADPVRFDRAAIGENLIRSHSAAPSLDSRLPLGPPPGLASRETPPVSNRSTGDSYLMDSAVDRSRILQIGQRRPASTGVIGQNQNSSSAVLSSLGLSTAGSGAVRPAAKTLMDLIQEDYPDPYMQGDFRDGYPRDAFELERPRTTSPLSMQREQYLYANGDILARDGRSGLSHALDRLQVRPGDPYLSTLDRPRPTPQYVQVDRQARPQGEARLASSIYAPVATTAPHNQPPSHQSQAHGIHPHQQGQFEQQQGFSSQTQPVQTQILPSGHTVFVNAGPPPPYGYATVQYHPQQHHIVHQTVPGGVHPNEQQYISVVPFQPGGTQVQGVAPGGTYAYWQPDGQPVGNGMGQTLTIVNAHGPGGVPIAVARVGNPGVESATPQGSTQHGARGKEKGGNKGRRGAPNTRRGGAPDVKHQAHPACSPLLEEFRAKKNRDWTIMEIKSHVVEFCQDQNGSRFIQQRLEVGDDVEKELVIGEVLPAVRRLRNDVFGNYVVQKLLDFGTPRMKADLRDTLQGEMLALSLQMYGCRVVQKALETLEETDLPRLLTEFHNNVLSCIHDQNGNHVIQKCIEVLSKKAKKAREDGDVAKAEFFSEQVDFIVDDVLGNVASLSCHPYGCRVLQRILEHCVEPKKSRALDEISFCHKTLLDDQYGNYVIQHVLQFGRHSDRDSVLGIVVENGLLQLSRQKFASNVVEKLLKYGTAQQRKAVVREMLKVVDEKTGVVVPDGTSVVLLMVRDAYANYVVQTTLDVIPECEEKRLLLEELNAHATELKNYTFAKHIVTKLSS